MLVSISGYFEKYVNNFVIYRHAEHKAENVVNEKL
jgi:hypothetical protein